MVGYLLDYTINQSLFYKKRNVGKTSSGETSLRETERDREIYRNIEIDR